MSGRNEEGPRHRRIIQSHMQYLVKSICVDSLLDKLYSCDVLSWNERVSIVGDNLTLEKKAELTLEEKAERLLIHLSKATANADEHFMVFIGLLPDHIKEKLDEQPEEVVLPHCPVSNLHTRVLLCHNTIKENVIDSLDIRVLLYECGRISFGDYKTQFVDSNQDKSAYCESLMHLLYYYDRDMKREPDEIERNLEYFRYALQSAALNGRYLHVVNKIDNADLTNNSYHYMDGPKLITNLNTPSGVRGITVLNRKIYAVLHNSPEIHVFELYDSSNQFVLKSSPVVPVEGLYWPSDIVADRKHGLLFVSNRRDKPGIFSIDPLNASGRQFHELVTDEGRMNTPAGMSLTPCGHLLVAYEKFEKSGPGLALFEIHVGGQLTPVKTVDLSSKFTRYILQPVMLPQQENEDELYVFSQLHKHNDNLHRICKVNSSGDMKAKPYGGTRRSMWPSVRSPWGVMVDPLSKPGENRFLISNCHEHKIVLLNDRLEYLRDVVNASSWAADATDSRFICPRCMCFDEELGFLYVGRRWKQVTERKSSDICGAISVFQIAAAKPYGI